MANWYVSRETLRRAVKAYGTEQNFRVDRICEAVSREWDRETNDRYFIPRTETRLYRWPQRLDSRGWILWIDQDLLSLTTLKSEAQNASPTTIPSTDYFLEPANLGRFSRIEIDLSSDAAFKSGDTPQRSISVLGSWGYSDDTRSVGTVSSGLSSSSSATSMVCSDASVVDVGDTLLIESEQIFVRERDFAALGSVLIDGALNADLSQNVTADSSHGIVAGEIIRVDSELMLVLSVSGTTVNVTRAYDGSTLAAHTNDTAIHINRTLTIERGVNGTTAATHADATPISKYEPPFDVVELLLEEASSRYHKQVGGSTGSVGAGDGARQPSSRELADRRHHMVNLYFRPRPSLAV